MIDCPEVSKLTDLILGTLPKPAADTLTDHVGTCTDCQSKMQMIASGEIPVESLVYGSAKAKPPQGSAYWNVREVMSKSSKSSEQTSDLRATQAFVGDPAEKTADAGNISNNEDDSQIASSLQNELSFLESSEDPIYLGRLQHFFVARVIGRGGMGVVLEAFDTHLHRRVAIKVLNPKFQQDEVARQRFCREGRAAAAISHEHVVQMYQVARLEECEIAFLVMQLVEGETLEARLKKQSPIPPKEVARIGMQIAAGLSAAHARGLVHRDIKPANILLETESARVKLTDFGLARVSDEVKLTQTGILTGTALYMSPEQALGRDIDERSDLFSLGAVMYEMATGISAFEAPTSVGVMKRIMDETPPAPHKVNPLVGKPTSHLIMQLISKSPGDRPETAGLVARALASVVTEFGPISPLQVPAIASSEVKKLSGRHSLASRSVSFGGWAIAGLLLTAFAVASLTNGLAWLSGSARSPNESGGVSVEINTVGNKPTDATSRFPSLVLAGNPGTVWSVDFAPDGKSIAAGIGDGTVRFWDIEKQAVLKSFNAHRGNVWTVKFHRTLDLVATAGDDGSVKVWDSKTFALKHEWIAENSVRGIAFSPDNKGLIAGDRAGKIHVYDLESGLEKATHSQSGSILGLDFSADGKSIATVGSDKTVRVFDTETFEQRQTFTGHEGPIYNVAFANDGPLLASVGWNKNIWIWNVETGAAVQQLDGSEGDNWGVAFCGFGHHLITGGQDGAARLWDLEHGTNTATLRGHTSAVHNVALDSSLHRIATSSRDGTIRIWDMSALQDESH